MKRVISILLVCILCICAGCSNPKQLVEPAVGKYYLDKEGSTSYIEVLENNNLLFSGINFTDIEENVYEKSAIAFYDQENDETGISLTELERDAKIQGIRDEIDLDKQFSGTASPFEYVDENGQYGFTAKVNGSSMWLAVMYQPNHNALIFYEHKYVLREGDGV